MNTKVTKSKAVTFEEDSKDIGPGTESESKHRARSKTLAPRSSQDIIKNLEQC